VLRLAVGDVLHLGMLGISTRKMRAALSALGISIGIATMIVVTGIPASSQQALLRELTALGTNMLQAEPQPNQTPPVLFSPNAAAMVRRVGAVTDASAVANTGDAVQRTTMSDPDDSVGITVLAAKDNLLGSINGRVFAGHFLSRANDRFPTAVVGYQAATWLGIDTLRAGQPAPQLDINGVSFTVIGILDSTPLASEIDQSVLIGWPAAEQFLDFGGNPSVVYVKANPDELGAVRSVLPATLDPQVPGLVDVSQPSAALAAQQDSQTTFSDLFLGLAGVALLVGGVGVANTMIISVLERRREIGLRRALGANRGQIRVQFLTEAMLLSLLGGLAGIAFGTIGTIGYAHYQGWPVDIPMTSISESIAGALLVGAVAGVYPSIRAARLMPTEALASA
jgi:putative ABC transport system permease protein